MFGGSPAAALHAVYAGVMLNPGSAPIPDASEGHAAANMAAFAAAVQACGVEVGEPQRDETVDDDGRFGYVLSGPGGSVAVLMPGVPLAVVRDDRSTSAPCLRVGSDWWWWPSAVTIAAGALR